MKLGILCPLSREEITDPVIYNGYTYDRSSINRLIDEGRLIEEKSKLIKDFFLLALIEYVKKNNTTQILLDEDELDKIYACPIKQSFPKTGVLCLADGRTYEEQYITVSYSISKTSPFTRGPITPYDLVYHQLHTRLVDEIYKVRMSKKNTLDLGTVFSNVEQSHPHFASLQLNSELIDKHMIIPHSLLAQSFMVVNMPWFVYPTSLPQPEVIEIPLRLLRVTSHIYTDVKLYRKFVLNLIEDFKNQNLNRYYNYIDSVGQVQRVAFNKKMLMFFFLNTALLLNMVQVSVLFEQFHRYNMLPIIIFNDPIKKLAINFSILGCLSTLGLSRALVEFHSFSILIRTDNLFKKCRTYLLEIFDQHAPRNNGKSDLKIKIEGITTLAMISILFPLAVGGIFTLSLLDQENENSLNFFLNFLVNFPLVALTTTTAINQVREFIFSRSDVTLPPSAHRQGFFSKVANGVSLTACAIAGYTSFSAFSSTGFFRSVGLGLNTAIAPTFEKCLDNFNSARPLFQKLDVKQYRVADIEEGSENQIRF